MEQENNLDALHEHYSFGADAGQEPLRVDKFLMNRIENLGNVVEIGEQLFINCL